MTTKDLTGVVLPYARHALDEARPLIIDTIGRAGWIVLWPAWAVVTGPLLPLLVRMAIELGIGLLGPSLSPTLGVVSALAPYISDAYLPGQSRVILADLVALLKTPPDELMEPVRKALLSPWIKEMDEPVAEFEEGTGS